MKKRFLSKFDGKKQEWLHIVLLLVLMLIAAVLVLQFIFGISGVSGDSMEPTLHPDDVVLYLRVGKGWNYGDMVALKMPSGESYIKRIVGMPGDTIDIHDGKLYRNGVEEAGDYPFGLTDGQVEAITYPYQVEPGRYFVLGDNREVSVDSRTFGTVSEKQIKGAVIFVFYGKA